ncbi:MAG: MOSC domain-containing protein YiiM [Myxococcota bacterium]|jgi:MOSC domain-containing protein YiiM
MPLADSILALPSPPRDVGTLVRLVVRPAIGERRQPAAAILTPQRGIEGDRWANRAALYPSRYALRQVSAMRADVADVLTGDKDPILTGDNLHLDLDLSYDNLPTHSRIRVGTAILAVTPKRHSGCKKFRDRFGNTAAKLNGDPRFYDWRLRGVLLVVVEGGVVRPGDAVAVIHRGAP